MKVGRLEMEMEMKMKMKIGTEKDTVMILRDTDRRGLQYRYDKVREVSIAQHHPSCND